MSNLTVYRATPKGEAELAAIPGTLKLDLSAILAAVGEKATLPELEATLPGVKKKDFELALAQLLRDGFVETLPGSEPSGTDSDSKSDGEYDGALDDLDGFLSEKPREPTLQQIRDAEVTLSGARPMKAGYQISILHRADKPIAPRSGDKHVILLIDGQQAEALKLARTLMQAGFDVRGAVTRSEIVSGLRKPRPDLILMDLDLPDAVGLDVLGKLREHPAYKITPIIVVTARAERDDIVAALAYGASGYLNKPVTPDAMLRHVKDALGLS